MQPVQPSPTKFTQPQKIELDADQKSPPIQETMSDTNGNVESQKITDVMLELPLQKMKKIDLTIDDLQISFEEDTNNQVKNWDFISPKGMNLFSRLE